MMKVVIIILISAIYLETQIVLAASNDTRKLFSKKVMNERVPTPNLFKGLFSTRQDHSRPQQRELHQLEYYANLDFYQIGGPFYIYMKDIGDHSTRWIEEGLMVDIARETGAALFTFDRRYFGNNRVTENTTFASLEFLTMEQSLSDIPFFIRDIRNAHTTGRINQIIVWGSRHGATIAAWARQRYPHFITAAWSSSGIFSFIQFSSIQYDAFHQAMLSNGGSECVNRIRLAFTEMETLIRNSNGEYLREQLNLCHLVNRDLESDVTALYESHFLIMLNYVDSMHVKGIHDFCQDMNFYEDDPFRSFARWSSYLHVESGDMQCFDHRYDDLIKPEFGQPGTLSGRRQFYYMQCTQLGLYNYIDGTTWLPFNIGIVHHQQKCYDFFGPEHTRTLLGSSYNDLITKFGGRDSRITNIIYTTGAIDSLNLFGRLRVRDENATLISLDGMAKSADLTSISNDDPFGLDSTKRYIRDQVIAWSS